MEQDANGNWYIRVPLLGETKRRIEWLSAELGQEPAALAGSMLHDILEDDEANHLSPPDVAAACGGGSRSMH